MTLAAEETEGLVALHGSTEEQAQNAAYLLIEFLGSVLTLLDKFLVGIGQIIVVVGIGSTHRQTVGPGTELKIESVLYRLVSIMTATPVGDDYSIEPPIVLQDLVEQDLVVTVMLVLIKIIGTHDGPSPTFLHCSLEGRQIDLMQGTVGHDHIHLMTVLLVIVQCVVLHTGSNT